MTTPLRPLLLSFVILHSSFVISYAAPPPELTVLRTQYDKVVAERVTAPFDAAVGDLNAKYTGGLDRGIAEAKQAGDLKSVLAIEAEKKRLADKLPIPDEDDDETPPALKKLRPIYREQWKKLDEQRTANHSAILPAYTARLQALEATLTKGDRVDEAKEVMQYREALSLGIAATAPSASETKATAASMAAQKSDDATLPKGDVRAAAEWVLSIGGKIGILEGTKWRGISAVTDLPKGKITLVEITLSNYGANKLTQPVTDADLVKLAGLPDLKVVIFHTLAITDEGMKFLLTCPNVTRLTLETLKLTDAFLPHLRNLTKLERLNITYNGVQGTTFNELARLPLRELHLYGTKITDAGIDGMAGFTQLEDLDLGGTNVTDAGIVRLSGMKKLGGLRVVKTAVTPKGLAALKNQPITIMNYGKTGADMVAQSAEVAKLFPNLSNISFTRYDKFSAADVETVVRAFPNATRLGADDNVFEPGSLAPVATLTKLESVYLRNCKLEDADLAPLLQLKKLQTLELGGNNATDAIMPGLMKLKSLKSLKLGSTTTITDTALAAFKKARPDVKVEK